MEAIKKSRRERGFSMVEAMVSVLVLSGGLLGLAFLQAQGMKFNTEAYQRSQATVLAYDIIDRLRANPAAANSNSYEVTSAASAISAYNSCKTSTCYCNKPDGSGVCDADALATFDLGQWYLAQQQALALDPDNSASIERTTISSELDRHVITMRWLEQGVLKTQEWEVQLHVPAP